MKKPEGSLKERMVIEQETCFETTKAVFTEVYNRLINEFFGGDSSKIFIVNTGFNKKVVEAITQVDKGQYLPWTCFCIGLAEAPYSKIYVYGLKELSRHNYYSSNSFIVYDGNQMHLVADLNSVYLLISKFIGGGN